MSKKDPVTGRRDIGAIRELETSLANIITTLKNTHEHDAAYLILERRKDKLACKYRALTGRPYTISHPYAASEA